MLMRSLSLSLIIGLATAGFAQQTASSSSAPALPATTASVATPVPDRVVFSPTPADKNPPPAHFSYYGTESSDLAALVHAVPATDADRLKTLETAFAKVDCTGDRARNQILHDKHDADARNLICTWPGKSPNAIVVIAHYIRDGKGDGAIDNWSGAAVLPALYLALQNQPRQNTFIFVETAGKKGDSEFIKSLAKQDKRNIRAVIGVDGLGVGSGLRFFTASESPDPPIPAYHLQLALLFSAQSDNEISTAVPTNPGRWLTLDDTTPFRYSEIPTILIHSVAQADADIPDSPKDISSALDTNAYYSNYKALAIYLVALDTVAEKLGTNDKLWGAQSGYRLNLNDLPYIH